MINAICSSVFRQRRKNIPSQGRCGPSKVLLPAWGRLIQCPLKGIFPIALQIPGFLPCLGGLVLPGMTANEWIDPVGLPDCLCGQPDIEGPLFSISSFVYSNDSV